MALAVRGVDENNVLIHHSDRGTQPGLNRSSQQLTSSQGIGVVVANARSGVAERGLWRAAVVAEARP